MATIHFLWSLVTGRRCGRDVASPNYGEQTRALRGSLANPDLLMLSEERMLLLSSRAAERVDFDRLAERVLTTPRANDVKFLKLV